MLLLIVIIKVVIRDVDTPVLGHNEPPSAKESNEPFGLLRGQQDESWHIKISNKQDY